MKKVIGLLMIGLALTTSLHAQVKFMLKAGGAWATVTFDDNINDQYVGDFDYGSKVGLIIGLSSEIPLGGDVFALQPELLFHQKGYTSKYEDTEVSDSYTHTLNYLEAPVLARVNFGSFYAVTGPYVAFGVGGKYKGSTTFMGHPPQEFEGKVNFGEEPDNYNGSDLYVNAVDFGIQIGAGVKVSAITFDLRYGLGLTDLIDRRDLNTNTLNRSLQLTVGFPIRGKK